MTDITTQTKAELLALNETTTDRLVIIKEFDAPLDLVFDVLTKHEHIVKWYSPDSMEVVHSKGKFAVGETYSIGMKPKEREGPVMELVGEFREIDPPIKVVYTQSYVMPQGNSPETMINIELRKDGNKTQMIFIHSGFADAKSRDQALQSGWAAAMKKVEQVISDLQNI